MSISHCMLLLASCDFLRPLLTRRKMPVHRRAFAFESIIISTLAFDPHLASIDFGAAPHD